MDYRVQAQDTTQTSQTSTSAKSKSDALGKSDFLKLLMAQLKYQDPMKPMDDKSFIAEMAQFNALEEQRNLNSTLTENQAFERLSSASNLIGKAVRIRETVGKGEDAEVVEVTGRVQQLKRDEEGIKLLVNGQFYDVNSVFEVANG
ncbi:MAG: flagellar hook capping FlgD N-terminal domain-containing protein [Bacteroidota bacterium]